MSSPCPITSIFSRWAKNSVPIALGRTMPCANTLRGRNRLLNVQSGLLRWTVTQTFRRDAVCALMVEVVVAELEQSAISSNTCAI